MAHQDTRATRATRARRAKLTAAVESGSALSEESGVSASLPVSADGARPAKPLPTLDARIRARVLVAGQITWTLKNDGSPVDLREWRLFTGQSEARIEAEGWQGALHPDDRERVAAAWNVACASNSLYEVDYRARRYDGEYRCLLAHGVPIFAEDGTVVEWAGTATDITERQQIEDDWRESREAQLAAELADMRRLQEISSLLIQEGNLDLLYEQILHAAIAVMRSDMGTMQRYDSDSNALHLLTWKGFDPAGAAYWERVRADSRSTCGVALSTGQRVIVSDVEICDLMAGTVDLEYYRLAGIKALQSTPLVSRSGRLVGMISTHWRRQHQPSERDLRLLDILARQAADLIERKQAEEVSAHLAAIVTSSVDAIISKTLDGIITSWNASAERMFGYSAKEAIGQSILLLIPPERRAEEDVILARIRAGERIEHFETIRVTKDGRQLPVSLTISPVKDSTGKIIGASKIARDITERKQADVLLSEQNRLLELIASGCLLDECLTALTRAVEKLQPRTRAAVLLVDAARERFASVVASDIPPSFAAGLQDEPINGSASSTCGTAVNSGQPIDCVEIVHDERWSKAWRDLCVAHGILAYHSEPVIGLDGEPLASLMLCFGEPRAPDGWELRIAQFGARIASIAIERDRVVETLRASERRKDEFLGIASHELRTPLTSITANVQLAERGLRALTSSLREELPEELPGGWESRLQRVRELMERTHRQVGRLDRLVGDLLDVSRIQAGKLEMRREQCDLLVIVREVVEAQRAA